MSPTRRQILCALSGSPALLAVDGAKPEICAFSKHLAAIPALQVGKKAKELGFEGVDLTVRPKGHVLPENAARDLRPVVESIRAEGLSVPFITTEITSASDPTARPILEHAAALKITKYKLGYVRYKFPGVQAQIERVKQETAKLMALGQSLGIEAGFHNHSGNLVGSAVWDIREIIRDMDPRWIGHYFDPAHARIEGGLGDWHISMDIAAPRMKMIAVKDFYWEKKGSEWAVRWCPLGQGMVNWGQVVGLLKQYGFNGPYSIHVEYETPDEPEALGKDLATFRKFMA